MIHRDNYHAVKSFLKYQNDVLQRDQGTTAAQWHWLKHLLQWADETPFAKAASIRPIFPRYLMSLKSGRGRAATGLTVKGIERACMYARMFLAWWRSSCRSIDLGWIETIRPGRIASEPHSEREAVSLELVRRLIAAPTSLDDLVKRRDKAAAAFLFLSGMRATAFCTLPIGAVDVAGRRVMQFPTLGVKTKNHKAAVTSLLEIEDLLDVAADWDVLVRAHLPADAPWYAVVSNRFGKGATLSDQPSGARRSQNLRTQLFALFDAAGLPRQSPHRFRHGHARYGLQQSRDIADLKAVSMNLMHGSLGITDSIYAVLSSNELHARIAQLGHHAGEAGGLRSQPLPTGDVAEIVRVVMMQLAKQENSTAGRVGQQGSGSGDPLC